VDDQIDRQQRDAAIHRERKIKIFRLGCRQGKNAVGNAAECRSLDDLAPLKSVGLHKLSGDRKTQWAMIINGPWRLCFRFEDGHAYDVEIVDYH
jgi:proteic killer suppression protein